MSNIYFALNAAMRDISAKGIAKLGSANLGGATVRFRGIEAAMNEMSPILVNHGITVTARYSELAIQERAKAEAGKATRFATIKGSFVFAAQDGTFVVAECYGEAMDSGDKATIKAQSVAFRTALFQQFVVPTMSMDTELDDDGEGGDEVAECPPELLKAARAAADNGREAFGQFWKNATPDQRALMAAHLDDFQARVSQKEVDNASR